MPDMSTALAQSTGETNAMPSLPQLIIDVPQPVWQKISKALRVKTRQEAVQLVQVNQQAAFIVSEIIRNSQSALTQGGEPAPSALTSEPPRRSLADRVYGGGKAKPVF